MRRYWTRELILEACHEWVATHGGPPKSEHWEGTQGSRFPTQGTVQKHFGSWSAMIVAAGFEAREKKTAILYWTPERIIEACLAFTREHGRQPFASDWRTVTTSTPNSATVIRRFGTWNAMIAAAGFTPFSNGAPTRWSKEAIAAAMLDWLLRTGKWPSCRDWYVPRPGVNPAHSTVFRTFGSWRAAKLYAGWDGQRVLRSRVEFACSGCGGDEYAETIGCKSCWDRLRKRAARAAVRSGAAEVVELLPGSSGSGADGGSHRSGRPADCETETAAQAA